MFCSTLCARDGWGRVLKCSVTLKVNLNGFYCHHYTVPMPLTGLKEVTGDLQLWVLIPWTIINAKQRNGSEMGGKGQKPTENFIGLPIQWSWDSWKMWREGKHSCDKISFFTCQVALRVTQVSEDSEIQELKYSQWNQSWHLLSWCIAKAEVRLK